MRFLAWIALAWLFSSPAFAGAGTITTKDAGGTTRTFVVVTDGSGNFVAPAVLCDQSAAATCASVGTAGSPSTNALTVQSVTLGHGTAANAMRVELPTDGTGLVTVNPATIGNWGLQVSTQNSATPTNAGLVLGQFNTTPTTITNGNVSPLQLDNAGNLLVNIKAGSSAGTVAQGSTTSGQSGILEQCAVTTGAPTYTTAQTNPLSCDTAGNLRVNVITATGLAQGSTTSGQTGSLVMGAVTTSAPSYTTAQTSPVSLTTAGATRHDVTSVNGVTVLTGTGATGTGAQRVTVSTDQATNAGAALVKGGVGVVNGGSFYEAVAASQTATVLQSSTGATGDYLSHCVIFPTSTSPGVVTVFDNTNTAANSAVLFAGGSSSTSNLTPIAVPVGAISVNGAWKVTTGANVSVVCYGKFS